MKQIRLNGTEQRNWNQNLPWLVSEKGVPIRVIDPELNRKASEILQLARRKEANVKQVVKLADPSHTPERGERQKTVTHEISVIVKRVGGAKRDVRAWCMVDGLLRVSTREIMCARYFKTHGECQLRQVNGKFLKVVRDPNRKITNVAHSVSGQSAPKPENCQCFQWGGREKGRHHFACQYNLLAPPEEQGYAPGAKRPELRASQEGPAPTLARALVTPEAIASVVSAQPRIPAPENCACKDFDGAVPGEHMPICEFFEAWKAQEAVSKGGAVKYLVALDSGAKLREATPAEVSESEAQNGFPLITLGEEIFAVLTEEEAASELMAQLQQSTFDATHHEEAAPNTERGANLPSESPPEELSLGRPEDFDDEASPKPPIIKLPDLRPDHLPTGITPVPGEEEEGLPIAGLPS